MSEVYHTTTTSLSYVQVDSGGPMEVADIVWIETSPRPNSHEEHQLPGTRTFCRVPDITDLLEK